MRYAGRFVCGVLLIGLAACHRPPPPAPPVALAPPPVIEHPKPPGPVNASWSFSIMQSACVAHAANREASLMLRFGSNGKLEFVLSSPSLRSAARHAGIHGRLQFHGGAGSWTWSARTTAHRTLSGLLPASQSAANDVMIALGGGALRTELMHARVPLLRIPAANVAGRDWFECVRTKIGHANAALIPAGRKFDSSVYGRPAGIALISRAAAPPTPRAYQPTFRSLGMTRS